MIRLRKLKLAVAALIPVLILFTCPGGAGYATGTGKQQKHETVYAYLDHDGTVLTQSVVNRIAYSGVDQVEDYGEYTSIKGLNHKQLPDISGSRVIWEVPKYKPGVLIYEGVTGRELPVKVSISYFLNGRPVKGEELAGREGKVTIKIMLENRLREKKKIWYKNCQGKTAQKEEEIYVPLLVQVTIPVDLERFHYIESEEAIKVVSGETMNVSFAAFPYPDQELALDLEGKDIKLDPITLAVIPMMPSLPEVEFEDDLDALYTGVKSLNKAVSELEDMKGSLDDVAKLVDGAGELSRGGHKLADSSGDLLEGMREFVNGTVEISNATGMLSEGLSLLNQGCSQLNRNASQISQAAKELAGGLEGVADASGGLVTGLGGLTGSNAMAVELVEGLLSEGTLDPLLSGKLSGLLQLLQGQQLGIAEISAGAAQLQDGLNGLAQGSREFTQGLNDQLVPGISQIAENTNKLAGGAGEIYSGTRELTRAGRKLYRGTAEYLQGVDELSGGLEELNDGLLEMDREINRLKDIEMVDTEGKSLDDIEYSLQESLEELRLGKSTADQMELLAEQYVSFMDNYRNKDSNVQFIMKTKAIGNKLSPGPSTGDAEKPPKSFWQKLRELFKLR